jgi:hypothetical protein
MYEQASLFYLFTILKGGGLQEKGRSQDSDSRQFENPTC